MRSPIQALIWEMWAGHRRNWLTIVAALAVCAVLFRILGDETQKSDLLQSLCIIPAMLMLGLLMSIFNFTEVNPRKGFAGFPQRLFSMPIRTYWLVGCPMVGGMLCVIVLLVLWTELVLRPAGFAILIRWPATLLAAAVVFYQSIIWCLSGYRITRLLVLSCMLSFLAMISIIPFLPKNIRGSWSEGKLTAVLSLSMLASYGAAVIAVGRQRRGAEVGWLWRRAVVQRLIDSIPHRQWNLSSPDRALLWMAWRRSGWVLPMVVLFMALFILGPVMWLSGTGPEATVRGFLWLAASPLLFAIPIGRGIAKPDFWSLELGLSPFLTARPVSNQQLMVAKLKTVAISTMLTYGIVFVAASLVVAIGDPERVQGLWRMIQMLYSPLAQWMIAILGSVVAMLLTWNLLVGSLWLGYSGRPWFYYTGVVVGIAALVASLIAIGVACNLTDDDSRVFLSLLHWIPWALAAAFILKVWAAIWIGWQARNRGLISDRAIAGYLLFWAAGTLCFLALAWFLSPRVDWLRYTLYLAALLAVPVVRIEAALLSVAWNRHR